VTAACTFSLSMAQVKAEDRFLVDEGKAYAEIIISESPPRSTRLAAAELQTYVAKISGARLPIRAGSSVDVPVQIYVGESPHAAKLGVTADRLEHGAYRIVSGKDWLALVGDDTDFQPHDLHARDVSGRARIRGEFDRLTGGRWAMPIDKIDRRRHAETGWWQDDRRGSLNAVHDFLRSLGVRWFMPGELGEVVSGRDSIPLPRVDRIVRPDFAMRHHDCNRWDLISRDEILWHFRLGLNWGGEYLGLGRRHGMQAVLAREEMKLEQQFPAHGTAWTQTGRRGNLGKPTENEDESLSHRFCDIRSPAVGRRRCLRRPSRRNPIFTAYLRRPGIAEARAPGLLRDLEWQASD
jgi:hypothetical protein